MIAFENPVLQRILEDTRKMKSSQKNHLVCLANTANKEISKLPKLARHVHFSSLISFVDCLSFEDKQKLISAAHGILMKTFHITCAYPVSVHDAAYMHLLNKHPWYNASLGESKMASLNEVFFKNLPDAIAQEVGINVSLFEEVLNG